MCIPQGAAPNHEVLKYKFEDSFHINRWHIKHSLEVHHITLEGLWNLPLHYFPFSFQFFTVFLVFQTGLNPFHWK